MSITILLATFFIIKLLFIFFFIKILTAFSLSNYFPHFLLLNFCLLFKLLKELSHFNSFIFQLQDLGESIQHTATINSEPITCPVIPLKNIYLSPLNILVQVKLRISLMMAKLYLKPINLW